MSGAPSQRDKDMARRARSPGRQRAGGRRHVPGWAWAAVAVALGALLVWAAWPSPSADDPALHFAAFALDDDPYLGDPDAPVVLVGYESPHCSSCQFFHRNVLPELSTEFFDTGDVVFYYIQGTLGNDLQSNMAQECAYEHGDNAAFWLLTDRFYNRSYTYSTPALADWLRDVADELDLDGDAMVACLEGGDTRGKVSEDWDVGSENGARGTPTFWAFGPTGEVVRITSMGQVGPVLRDLVASPDS